MRTNYTKSQSNVQKIDDIQKDKTNLAKVFSEGCKELESLLLYSWENNLQTRGCCAGHRIKIYQDFPSNEMKTLNGYGYFALDFEDKEQCKQFALQIMRTPLFQQITSRKNDDIIVTQFDLDVANSPLFGWKGLVLHFPTTMTSKDASNVFLELKNTFRKALISDIQAKTLVEKQFVYIIDEVFDNTRKSLISVRYNVHSKQIVSKNAIKLLENFKEPEKLSKKELGENYIEF